MYEMPPVCAEESLCTGEILTDQITTVNREIAIKTNGAKSPVGQSITVILYGAIGGLLFIIVLLLLIIVGCTVYNVGNHKIITATRGMPSSVSNPYMYDTSYTIFFIYTILVVANKTKYHAGQSLNVYDDQPAKSDNNAFAMDTPVVKGKLYT